MIRALLSVLPRSSCASWSRRARNPPAAVPPAQGREALLREPPAQRMTSGMHPELSRVITIKETKKCSFAFFRLNEYARSSRTFPSEKFSSLSGLKCSGRGISHCVRPACAAGSRKGQRPLTPRKMLRIFPFTWLSCPRVPGAGQGADISSGKLPHSFRREYSGSARISTPVPVFSSPSAHGKGTSSRRSRRRCTSPDPSQVFPAPPETAHVSRQDNFSSQARRPYCGQCPS